MPQPIFHDVIDRIEVAVSEQLRDETAERQADHPREWREEIVTCEVTYPSDAASREDQLADVAQSASRQVSRELLANDRMVNRREELLDVEAYPPAIRSRPCRCPPQRSVCASAATTSVAIHDGTTVVNRL